FPREFAVTSCRLLGLPEPGHHISRTYELRIHRRSSGSDIAVCSSWHEYRGSRHRYTGGVPSSSCLSEGWRRFNLREINKRHRWGGVGTFKLNLRRSLSGLQGASSLT